jgi:signal transduction histidine kinase
MSVHNGLCPVSGMKITMRDSWRYVAHDGHCSCNAELVGDNIIVFRLSGSFDAKDAAAIRKLFLNLLNDENLKNKPTYCLSDMSKVQDTVIGSKKDYSHWSKSGRKHLQLMVYYGVHSQINKQIEVGISASKKEGSVVIAEDYEEAHEFVLKHESRGSIQLTRKQLEALVHERTEELSEALENSRTVKEQLNEMFLDVVHAQEKAEEKLKEAENLLSGLQILNSSLDSDTALQQTVTLLKNQLNYEDAFLLTASNQNSYKILSSTSPVFQDSTWTPQKLFNRVLAGATIPVFDITLVPEWEDQNFKHSAVSALHVPLRTGSSAVILVCTHSKRGFFTQKHADIAERFSVLATQSLLMSELLDELKQERDSLETRVEERTSEIKAILNAQPDLMFRIDSNGVFLDCRKPKDISLYINPEKFIGKNISKIMPDHISQKYLSLALIARETEEVQVYEYELEVDQSIRNYEARLVVPKGASENLVFVRDITRRKAEETNLRQERSELALRVEERTFELQAMNAELMRAVEVKDKFLAIVTHELRTPLNVILGVTEALEDDIYGPLNDRQLRSTKRVTQSGMHLLELINDILDVTRIDSGHLALNIDPTSVNRVCRSCVELISEVARSRNIDVEISNCDEDVIAYVDELRLRQMLMNLLGNAIKFTNEGGSVGLQFEFTDNNISFTVWDTGIGIAKKDFDKMFEHFVQLDSSLARQYQGSGLGLALVRRLAEMHGGFVVVESKVGVGSKFIITLPRQGC